MKYILSNMEPKLPLKYFEDISAIPRGSKNEEAVAKFVENRAKELGLYAIVRPSPYICAEWDFGGLPSWLLKYPHMALRCDDPLYLEKVKPYYRELLSRLRPHLCTNGGNILMVQVENEIGRASCRERV